MSKAALGRLARRRNDSKTIEHSHATSRWSELDAVTRFFLAQNRRRATSASSARRNSTCTIPYFYLSPGRETARHQRSSEPRPRLSPCFVEVGRMMETGPSFSLRNKVGSGMIRLVWNSSAMSAPVEPVLGSTPLLKFGNVRSPPVILAALPALSCQVWKCPISEPPILSRIRKTSKLVTSWATAGYRLRDRTPNLRRGPRSKLGALITLTGLSGVYSLSRAQLRVMSLSLRFHRLVSMTVARRRSTQL